MCVKVKVVLDGNTDKHILHCKYQDTKILPIHFLLQLELWISLLDLTSNSSHMSLESQEKVSYQVSPIMSRPVMSVGKAGPDPILHQQED